jgi:hypothetical protein
MRTEEIKETDWPKFCEKFEAAHRDAKISLEVIHHDGSTALIAKDEPLARFWFHKTQDCTDHIHIRAGGVEHRVIDPIHMRVREQSNNQKMLEIDAETGSVEMRFSSGRIGAILSELELLEPAAMGREGGRQVSANR